MFFQISFLVLFTGLIFFAIWFNAIQRNKVSEMIVQEKKRLELEKTKVNYELGKTIAMIELKTN